MLAFNSDKVLKAHSGPPHLPMPESAARDRPNGVDCGHRRGDRHLSAITWQSLY